MAAQAQFREPQGNGVDNPTFIGGSMEAAFSSKDDRFKRFAEGEGDGVVAKCGFGTVRIQRVPPIDPAASLHQEAEEDRALDREIRRDT